MPVVSQRNHMNLSSSAVMTPDEMRDWQVWFNDQEADSRDGTRDSDCAHRTAVDALKAAAAADSDVCKYGEDCYDALCGKEHPPGRCEPCGKGDDCYAAECLLFHPREQTDEARRRCDAVKGESYFKI